MTRQLDAMLSAAIEVAVEAVLAGFGQADEAQRAMRDKGADLRDRAATRALLGPALATLAAGLVGEVERRTAPRYEAALRHPLYGREALVDELTDAEKAMNVAIAGASSPPGAAQALGLAIAAVRVRAIATALGGRCFADPARAKRETGYPAQRRRTITAADIDDAVAQQLLALAERGADWRDGLELLRALETTAANRSGSVSKIVALVDQEDGRAHLDHMAATLRAAGVVLHPLVRSHGQRQPASTLWQAEHGRAGEAAGRELGTAAMSVRPWQRAPPPALPPPPTHPDHEESYHN